MLRAGLFLCLVGCTDPTPPAPVTKKADDPLAKTHTEFWRHISGHRVLAHSKIRMGDGRELIEDWTLEADGDGNYRLEHHNNQGLGKEAVFLDGVLFTRHRYGKFLKRGKDTHEAARIREEAWGVLAAYLDPLYAWLEVSREKDRLVFGKAKERRAYPPRYTDRPERQWRDTVDVESLRGWVLLDGGIATDAELHARYTFQRGETDGSADIEYTRYLTRGAPTISRPPLAIPSPKRQRLDPDVKKTLGISERKEESPVKPAPTPKER